MSSRTLAPVAALGALACFAPAAAAPGDGVTDTYFVGALTRTGADMSAGRPSPAAMMSMMSGGGGGSSRTLLLKLGASATAGPADATHSPPPGLKTGALPLLASRVAAAKEAGGPLDRVKGKIMIYWGCGEKAAPGQPLVIDLAQTAGGKGSRIPEGLRSATKPTPASHARYAEWPNRSTRSNTVTGSLVGDHALQGADLPEIRFTLSPTQDFLPPLALSTAAGVGGSTRIAWRPVTGAKAYFATMIGGGDNRDDNVVMWTSGAVPAAALMPDFLSNDEIARQLDRKVLLPASATGCVVPREVVAASPMGMLNVSAFAGEVHFGQPKPAGAKPAWKPEWTARVAYASSAGVLLGLEDEDAGDTRASKGRKGFGLDLLKGALPFPG